MKQLFALLFALILILTMSPGVRADVIYIPENPFIQDHLDDCTYVGRNFTPITEVKLYRSPEDDHVEWTYAAGDELHISYTYTDARNIEWGYTEDYDTQRSGWVPMAYLDVVYDYISFAEEYGGRIVYLKGVLRLDGGLVGQNVRFWEYPGSEGGQMVTVSHAPENLPYYFATFTDEDGMVWGQVNYYMGYRNFWICLDHPTADVETVYPNGLPQVELNKADPTTPEQEITPAKPTTLNTDLIIGAAVMVCVVITCALLGKRKKKA